ncbi:MAG: hypothetical protein ACR2QK_08905, partial [Acidimicrobiales bacterium]
MTEDPRLSERLKQANEQLTISSAVRNRHRSTIQAELNSPTAVVPRRPKRQEQPRRLALVAATLLIGPVAALFVSSGAAPGDALYPTKRAVERVVSLIDNDRSADNRLEELDDLIARGSGRDAIAEAQDDAYAAIGGLGDDHPFVHRYQDLVLGARRGPDGVDPNYRHEADVDWAGGEPYRTSLPNGDVLIIERIGGE